MIFEGVIGTGYRGDIALDDILISYGQCEIGGNEELFFSFKIITRVLKIR